MNRAIRWSTFGASEWSTAGSYEMPRVKKNQPSLVWTAVLCEHFVQGSLSTSEGLVWIPQRTSVTSSQSAAFAGFVCTADTVCSL
jgi:hypothetical protein